MGRKFLLLPHCLRFSVQKTNTFREKMNKIVRNIIYGVV